MENRSRRLGAIVTGLAAVSAVGAGLAVASTTTGPSTDTKPYVVRSQPGVVTKSILTVGDGVGGYRMAGIPDGLGAYDNGDGTFTLLSNHELRPGTGAVRDHGQRGAFVSKWTIDKGSLRVEKGEDLVKQVVVSSGTTEMNRLCSADLAPISAFHDAATGTGYDGRIFTSGEEADGGRGFGHVVDTGVSYELPRLGKFAYENIVAHPDLGQRTVTVGLDDRTPGQVYFYEGTKTSSGSAVDRAGLTNGTLSGVKVPGAQLETPGTPLNTTFTLASLGDVSGMSGPQLEAASDAAGVTEFLRPEDGAWDPTNPNVFYFVTTHQYEDGRSRLYKLTFADLGNLAAGGKIEAVLDGTEGQKMMDNLTINRRGHVIIQEDPGNQERLARVWEYSPKTDRLYDVARFDSARFSPGAPGFITADEESSGIIDARGILGEGWYLLDAQVHKNIAATEPDLVEMGQYMALHIPPGKNK